VSDAVASGARRLARCRSDGCSPRNSPSGSASPSERPCSPSPPAAGVAASAAAAPPPPHPRPRTSAAWALAIPWHALAATVVAFAILHGHPTSQLNAPPHRAGFNLWGTAFLVAMPLAALQTLGTLAAAAVAIAVPRLRADVPSWLAAAAANAITVLALVTNAPDA